MEITTITITISAVVLFLAIVSPLINPFFRLPKTKRQEIDEDAKGVLPVSIIIIAHDNAPELEKHLPMFLSQDYAPGYEVIVVADKSDSETDDVIKRFSSNEKLYATFMPLSSRYLSRKKLAVTLGVKAAHNDWVIITDAWCSPQNENWLKSMTRQCIADNTMVLGVTKYGDDAPSHYKYEHLRTALYNLFAAERLTAFGCNSPLLAIRKDLFMKEDGFLGNLMFTRGEYDFTANKFAEKGCTGIAVEQDAILKEVSPISKEWSNKHLYAINTHHNMRGNIGMTLLYQIDMMLMHLCNITIIIALAYGILTNDYIVIGSATLSFIIEYTLRAIIGAKAMEYFNVQVSAWIIPLLDFTQTLRNICWRIKYIFADKTDFITHKL